MITIVNTIFLLADEYCSKKIKYKDIHCERFIDFIITNRIIGIAFDNLIKKSLPKKVYIDIKALYENDKNKTDNFKENLIYISYMLKNIDIDYALLKGAFLITHLYPKGHRTSNDIDILVNGEDISKIQDALLENGFVQGYYSKQDGITTATRKEIVESRMNFGETIPFIKMINEKPLIIDINFSVDFKPSTNNIVKNFLNNVIEINYEDMFFKTLNHVDFIIHLCCHLYKEATTYDWVLPKYDLMLYKFSDINVFLHEFGCKDYFLKLLERIKCFEVEKECYYTFENASIIYPKINNIEGFESFMKGFKLESLDFMRQITYPREKKLYRHNMNFKDWFFCENRVSQLEEIV